MPVFSMFVGQHGLDAAINDELQPPLAYAELADQDASGPWANVVDPDDQVLPRLQEYERNLEHVNAAIQLRQAKHIGLKRRFPCKVKSFPYDMTLKTL